MGRRFIARAAERPEWGEAAEVPRLGAARPRARAPFDFYGRVLGRLDARGLSMRQRLLTRLGAEAEDAIDAFLAEALAAEGRGATISRRFIADMTPATSRSSASRRAPAPARRGAGDDRARRQGAGGAGGDPARHHRPRATAQRGPLLDAEGGGFLWAPRRRDDCPASAEAARPAPVAAAQEWLRLLYVALTRARDRLIVCGVARQAAQPSRAAGTSHRAGFDASRHARRRRAADGGEGCRYGPDPHVARPRRRRRAAARAAAGLGARPRPGRARRRPLRLAVHGLGEAQRGPAPRRWPRRAGSAATAGAR